MNRRGPYQRTKRQNDPADSSAPVQVITPEERQETV
jgi:hypothetical protein